MNKLFDISKNCLTLSITVLPFILSKSGKFFFETLNRLMFVKQVLADNKDTLKLVYRHFPLTQIHKNALGAAIATEAAGVQGKFWEMHDILYDKQEEWGNALNARDYFLTYATTIGLDTKKFQESLSNESLEAKVLAEFREGVRLGVQGTPTFFLNGKKLDNPLDLARFNSLVKEASKESTLPSSN